MLRESFSVYPVTATSLTIRAKEAFGRSTEPAIEFLRIFRCTKAALVVYDFSDVHIDIYVCVYVYISITKFAEVVL